MKRRKETSPAPQAETEDLRGAVDQWNRNNHAASEMERWVSHQGDIQLDAWRKRAEVERELDRKSLRKFAIGLAAKPGINQFEVIDALSAADQIIQYILTPSE